MKALILAAGKSSRLRPLTDAKHKCLIDIYDNKKIIDIELENLRQNGVKDIVIVIGYFGSKIRDHISKNFPDLNITYVENKEYETTGCIYSLWLASEYLDDDLIYMTGDIVMDATVLQKMLSSEEDNIVYVNKEAKLPEKDFKARIIDGVVEEIGIDVFGEDASFCLPLIKLSKKATLAWLKEADNLIKTNKVKVYETEALNKAADEIKLKPIYLTDFCAEVDDHQDLGKVIEHFSQ